MKKLFVPFGIALKLKEKRFNEDCLKYYNPAVPDKVGGFTNTYKNSEQIKDFVAAPTWQQALDWLRESYAINIYLYLNAGKDAYHVVIESEGFVDNPMPRIKQSFEYYEAFEIGIEGALTLIK
jgi:hypothetical protein